ncbi:MAG: hypothetical protein KF812_00765 [Fimbriimonadaceae bacterium]|nr:hypothetical protein [Fimbriimonadaceae bacterium]
MSFRDYKSRVGDALRSADTPILLTLMLFGGVGIGFVLSQGSRTRLELALSALPPSLAAIALFLLVFIVPEFWGERFRTPLNFLVPLLMAGFVYAASSLADTAGIATMRFAEFARTDLIWTRPLVLTCGFALSVLFLSGWAAIKAKGQPKEPDSC